MDVLERLQLKLGDHVDIAVENGRVYKSDIEDVLDEHYLVMSTPLFRGIPVIFHRDQEVSLNYIKDNGRYAVSARVAGFKTENALRFIVFEPYGQPIRNQLRNAYRLGSDLRGVIRDSVAGPFPMMHSLEDDEDEEHVRVVDISETGMGFLSSIRYEPGSRLFIRVSIAWPREDVPPLEFLGLVRRRVLKDPERGVYHIGVEFTGLDHETRKLVSRYVLVRQQQILKQKRLVEGED